MISSKDAGEYSEPIVLHFLKLLAIPYDSANRWRIAHYFADRATGSTVV